MSWFLVLLFWNPAIQDYDVADGWAPLPMASYERCEERREYAEKYLPSYTPDTEHMIGCIQAEDQQAAIAILRGGEID